MKECLLATRLATGETKEICASSSVELQKALDGWSDNGRFDLDLEYLSGSLTGKSSHQLPQLWVWSDLFNVPLQEVNQIANVVEHLEDVEQILEEQSYDFVYADNKFLAFRTFLERLGEFDQVPSHIVDYIDFETWYRDVPTRVERVEGFTNEYEQARYLILAE